MVKPTFVPTVTLRENLSQILNASSKKEGFFIVTRKGKPISALTGIDFFEDLLAKASPRYLKDIKEARREYKKRNFLTHEQLFVEI